MSSTAPFRELPEPRQHSRAGGTGWLRGDRFRKRALFVVFTCLASVVALLLLWQARSILLLLFAGYIGALIFSALTSKFQSWFHLRSRGLAFTAVIAITFAAFATGLWLRGSAFMQQFGDLQADIETAIRELTVRFRAQEWWQWLVTQSGDSSQVSRALSMMLSGVGGAIYLTATTIAGIFLVTMTSIYLAAEPQFYLRGLRRLLPTHYRPVIEKCFAAATRKLRAWLLAKLVSMATIGAIVTLGMLLIQVPLAGTLGIIAALLTFIPNLGPILSVVPAALLAFAISPMKGVLTIAWYCLAHFLEGSVITPLVERRIVRLPPALTLAVQLLLASVAGALGVALAAPLTAILLGVADVLLPPAGGESTAQSAEKGASAKKF